MTFKEPQEKEEGMSSLRKVTVHLQQTGPPNFDFFCVQFLEKLGKRCYLMVTEHMIQVDLETPLSASALMEKLKKKFPTKGFSFISMFQVDDEKENYPKKGERHGEPIMA